MAEVKRSKSPAQLAYEAWLAAHPDAGLRSWEHLGTRERSVWAAVALAACSWQLG